ncbi:hypothetical protein [Burkholderia sp. Bp9143]|uniref:hypothetical protein n=1 Tax=Burkholderia sp. Bp9143 TaxID=2184574 RepID=UPI0016243E9A|nr:hypothetical protein [Burkholderia sp. Bp9143]
MRKRRFRIRRRRSPGVPDPYAEMIRYRFAHLVITARPKLKHLPIAGAAGETS